jgi:penicillin-binding protein activator
MHFHHFLGLGITVSALAFTAVGCGGKEVVRDSNDPSIDNAAMSTGLDKDDIQRMLKENLDSLRTSPVMDLWRADKGQDTVAVFPFQNETSEHVDDMLAASLSEAETWLVESNTVTVVSRDKQNEMIGEVEHQKGAAFNPAHTALYGQQLGTKYFITGKVYTNDERTDDKRRVQYFFFMQIVEVATSVIRWQHKAYVTKEIR